jgi:hypothetical protein
MEEVDEALQMSLSKAMFHGFEETLTQTAIAQPVILAHSIMALTVLKVLSFSFDLLFNF